jgi:hypothetical protein
MTASGRCEDRPGCGFESLQLTAEAGANFWSRAPKGGRGPRGGLYTYLVGLPRMAEREPVAACDGVVPCQNREARVF